MLSGARPPAAMEHGGSSTGGGKERGEHGDPISGRTGAWAAVWWPGDGDEAAVEEELSNGGAQAQREGVGAVRTGEGGLLL
jgi:hypothetical protein